MNILKEINELIRAEVITTDTAKRTLSFSQQAYAVRIFWQKAGNII